MKVVLHEVGHAIGLNHEHTRPDRDQFVWVRQEYMKGGHQHNSNLKSWEDMDDLGITYDYSSIMHYGANVRFASIQYPLGQRVVYTIPDRKVHGVNMGPTWGRQAHVGPMNLLSGI